MKILRPLFLLLIAAAATRADNLDTLGFTALRAAHPELTGAGQTVAQVEAGDPYQVNPGAVGISAATFRYYDASHVYGTGGASFASASDHANNVGARIFGATTGGAPGVQLIENFSADYFVNQVVITASPVTIAAPIVNQSFVVTATDSSTIATINRYYDSYANQHGTLFINGLNNGAGTVTNGPASMYNGIAVGRTDGQHSGRAQLVAPEGVTSYATPWVTAAATVLRQGATLGYFGARAGTDPADARVLKVALLNGATKTAGWTHTSTDPLDTTYGAGIVNVKTAFDTLAGGQKNRSSTALTSTGTVSTSAAFTAPVSGLLGWDLNALTAQVNRDAVAHYFFDLNSETSLTLTATLTWNSIVNLTLATDRISNFDLVLVDSVSHSIVWSSTSTAYNVEHIYLENLTGSKYDLQVILRGGAGIPASTDTYAVAWAWQVTGTTPVPESDFAWAIGAMGLIFAARRFRATRRSLA